MTFGIDISGFQAGMDLAKAKAEGTEFVIVKASGFNVSPLYVADEYHKHVDAAIAAGLPVGHYFLIGGGQVWKTPTEQAQFFVQNLYRFDPERHVLMLDNEGLNANGYLFDDAEAAEFMAEAIRLSKLTSVKRMWHYAGARDYRNLKPWPKIEALGIRYVWAAYGDYPTGKTPDHEPSLQGSIPRWDVHQFTSRSAIAGKSVDGNYSNHSVDVLFGGGSTTAGGGTSMAALQECYGTLVTPYGEPGEFYDALGHRGADYRRGARQEIIAYDDMSVEYVGSSSALGTVIGLRRLNLGGFAGYAHAYAAPPVGRFIPKGQPIALVAGSGDIHGSSWTGPHIHTTQSAVSALNAALGVRPLSDPAPAIARALSSSTAGGGVIPIGEDIMALKGALELINVPEENKWYLAGPFTWQELANQDGVDGGVKVRLFRDKFGVPVTTLSTGDKNALRITLLANQAAADNAKYAASLVDSATSVGLTDAQLDALIAGIVAKWPQPAPGGSGPSVAEIAAAVRAEFKANPLA